MQAFGKQIGTLLTAGDVVVLSGPLGAGKTTFVQGLAEELNVQGAVTSPTFVVSRVHKPKGTGLALVHVDAYRLSSQSDLVDLDLDATKNAAFCSHVGRPRNCSCFDPSQIAMGKSGCGGHTPSGQSH